MRLEKYLFLQNLSVREFASSVGVTHAHIINIIKGRRSPSLILAKQIEEATKGAVTIYELIDPKVPSRYKVKKNDKEISNMGD